jgi:hypothetical protein
LGFAPLGYHGGVFEGRPALILLAGATVFDYVLQCLIHDFLP